LRKEWIYEEKFWRDREKYINWKRCELLTKLISDRLNNANPFQQFSLDSSANSSPYSFSQNSPSISEGDPFDFHLNNSMKSFLKTPSSFSLFDRIIMANPNNGGIYIAYNNSFL
jgi:hypothetical protein